MTIHSCTAPPPPMFDGQAHRPGSASGQAARCSVLPSVCLSVCLLAAHPIPTPSNSDSDRLPARQLDILSCRASVCLSACCSPSLPTHPSPHPASLSRPSLARANAPRGPLAQPPAVFPLLLRLRSLILLLNAICTNQSFPLPSSAPVAEQRLCPDCGPDISFPSPPPPSPFLSPCTLLV